MSHPRNHGPVHDASGVPSGEPDHFSVGVGGTEGRSTSITRVRPWGREAVDIEVRDGRIASVSPAESNPGAPTDRDGSADVVDGGGMLALPAFSDVHTHLDSTRLGLPFRPHTVDPCGGIPAMITNDREHWREDPPVADRATYTLGLAAARGTSSVRSFAQVDGDCGFERLDGVLAARDALAEYVDVQVVAFPQAGLFRDGDVVGLLREAVDRGADLVGGIDPCALDRDPKRHLDAVFAIAADYDADIDVHLHEPSALGGFSFGEIIARIRDHGFIGRATVSHAFCLDDPETATGLIDDIVELDIGLTTVAPGNAGALPLPSLIDAGVRVGLGQDGQRDFWSPYGSADMLDRTWQLAFTQKFRADGRIEDALRVATTGGRSIASRGAGPVPAGSADGFAVGDPADFVLLDTECTTTAVMDRPTRRTVIHRGRVTAEDGTLVGISAPVPGEENR